MSKKLTPKNDPNVPMGHMSYVHDDDQTRVTYHVIRPGEQSGWHDHTLDYIGVHFAASKLFVQFGDGTTGTMPSKPGHVNKGKRGTVHNVTNIGDTDMVAFEIEFKKPVAKKAPAIKAPARKTAARKPAAKKAAARKTVTKKPTAKRAAPRRRSRA
ncbi:MAG: hypothetical protein AB7N54_04650 [Alphaproteobacteria bacterium]